MNRDVKVGDKIMVTEVNGEVLSVPHLTEITAVDNPEYGDWIDIKHAINGETCLFNDDGEDGDEWYPLGEFVGKKLVNDTETPTHTQYDDEKLSPSNSDASKPHEDVEVGDKIVVTSHNDILMRREAIVTEVYVTIIDVQFCDSGEEVVLYKNVAGTDGWIFASEDYEQQREEETLQHRQSHAYYDDEALSPTYSDAVKAGMTFAEYTGVNITEESLDFEPWEEEALRGITAESLNFEEAPKSDAVNHPSHYNRYSREVIESIKGLCTPEEFRGYLKGNIIKYSARYSGKDGLQDIDKLAKYTQFLKEFEIEMEGE